VLYYDLSVEPDINARSLKGSTKIVFNSIGPATKMQIDLQEPMKIDSAIFHSKKCDWKHIEDAWVLDLKRNFSPGDADSIQIYFSGKPREAKFAPWDGGLTWTKDDKKRDWVGVSCQGLGASVWWPNKDHQSDEPDKGMRISVTVGDSLVDVSNGKLISVTKTLNGKQKFTYEVKNPINNYDVTMNIGKYTTVTDTFLGKNGVLDIEYTMLDYNEDKIDKHIRPDTKKMLHCFEYWFGPYPFYNDGYRLVETHYLGMEHQSAIAYGNKFKPGYLGRDRSATGIGLLWDFIIIHESGHEWFGNNITSADIADTWIHEGFTTYSEALFIEYYYNKDSADKYLRGLRTHIRNRVPMIGPYGVNKEGEDNYEKGANLVHMIRQVIDNDSLFRSILIGLNTEFAKKSVSTEQIENYMIAKSGKDLKKMFDQYLRQKNIPELLFTLEGQKLHYKWSDCIKGFNMPVRILVDGKPQWLYPTTEEDIGVFNTDVKQVKVDETFYISIGHLPAK
jgi:aminopeptidase N